MSGRGEGQVSETPQQKAMMEFAAKQYRDYRVRQLPLQRHLAAVIEANNAPDSPARRLAVGRAATDTKIAFAKARTGLQAAQAESGVAPGSSRAVLAEAGLDADQAASTGVSRLISEQQADDAYTRGLMELTALGRGTRANVAEGLAGSAATSARQAQVDAEASLRERMGNASLAGTVVGGALGMKWPGGDFSNTPRGGGGGYVPIGSE